jgi:hypothetical protein
MLRSRRRPVRLFRADGSLFITIEMMIGDIEQRLPHDVAVSETERLIFTPLRAYLSAKGLIAADYQEQPAGTPASPDCAWALSVARATVQESDSRGADDTL